MQPSPLAASSDSVGRLRRLLTVLAAVLGATLVLLGWGMPAAWAHDELIATTPAADTTVPTPPGSVTLRFDEAVQALGTQVLVSGPDGAPLSRVEVEVEVSDATVVQPLPGDAPAGGYTVSWRVTSSDGHPLSGEFAFTVAKGTIPSAAPVEAPAASTGGADGADGSDGAGVSEAAARQPVDSSFPVGPIAIAAVLLAVAGGLALLLRRRRT
jgi:methionine-rich copper-binding protein CopC